MPKENGTELVLAGFAFDIAFDLFQGEMLLSILGLVFQFDEIAWPNMTQLVRWRSYLRS